MSTVMKKKTLTSLIAVLMLSGCQTYATTRTELPCPDGPVIVETGPKRLASSITCDGVEYEQVNTEVQGVLGNVLRFIVGI